MRESERREIEAVRTDVTSGATSLVRRAASVLARVAADSPDELPAAAAALVAAQPTMAGLLTLARLAATAPSAEEFVRFGERVRRAPVSIARLAVPLLQLRAAPISAAAPLRLVTCSASACVEAVVAAAARAMPTSVACAESRPACEGRSLAARLAAAGAAVSLYTDAGVSAAVPGADALLVGADAIGPDSFLNKVGTAALAAWAHAAGVPVYVVAGQEKRLDAPALARLAVRDGPPDDLGPPIPGVIVRNPYFERVPLQLVHAVITDGGVEII